MALVDLIFNFNSICYILYGTLTNFVSDGKQYWFVVHGIFFPFIMMAVFWPSGWFGKLFFPFYLKALNLF